MKFKTKYFSHKNHNFILHFLTHISSLCTYCMYVCRYSEYVSEFQTVSLAHLESSGGSLCRLLKFNSTQIGRQRVLEVY